MLPWHIQEWIRNNRAPRSTVFAEVVIKRACFGYGGYSERHYAAFRLKNGGRIQAPIGGSEYGLLAEGDRGNLTFQGTRYVSFERI